MPKTHQTENHLFKALVKKYEAQIAKAVATLIIFGPLLWYFSVSGIPLPIDYTEMGLIMAKRLIPVYSAGLIFSTMILVSIIVLIVSYLPSRKISQMKPTDALRGKAIA